MHRLGALAALLCSAYAVADTHVQDWEVVAQGAITVRARNRPGTGIREIWAEGEMAAPARLIQEVILDSERYPRFMPYVKECRYLGEPEPDGSRYVYTRLDLPWVTSRDYVLHVQARQLLDEQGEGTFENAWVAMPDRLPKRHSIIRLRINEGSWQVTPKNAGQARAVYRFTVDPGGWVPAFAANAGNTSGVMDTFRAIEKEAQRRWVATAKDGGP